MRLFTAIIFLTFTDLSLALGLSDIELKSSLGERFLAKLDVTDIGTSAEAGCFSASDAGDVGVFRKANITLKQNGGAHELVISTPDVITEPIVNLRVSSHCDSSVSRDYVLLLDPPAHENAEVFGLEGVQVATEPVKVKSRTSKKTKSQLPASERNAEPEDLTTNSKSNNTSIENKSDLKKKKAKQKKAVARTDDEKLMEAYTGKQQSALTTTLQQNEVPVTATEKPYLVLSGANPSVNGTAAPSLSLRLETQVDLARPEAAPLTDADMMDEVTVMTNRLGDLEKQVVHLTKRNVELQAEAEKAKNAGFKLPALKAEWLTYLLSGLGMLGVIAGALWVRRRVISSNLAKDQARWFDASTSNGNEPAITAKAQDKNPEASMFDEPSLYNQATLNTGLGFDNASSGEGEPDESESLLENADVFIAHERPALAVQLLQNYLNDSPAESSAVWLKLLNIQAKHSTELEYDVTATECKKFFNLRIPSYTEQSTRKASTIEDYPNVAQKLQLFWGTPEAVSYLSDLVFNRRAQPREGFELGAFEELFFLKKLAIKLHPETESSFKYIPPADEYASAKLLNNDVTQHVTPEKTEGLFEIGDSTQANEIDFSVEAISIENPLDMGLEFATDNLVENQPQELSLNKLLKEKVKAKSAQKPQTHPSQEPLNILEWDLPELEKPDNK